MNQPVTPSNPPHLVEQLIEFANAGNQQRIQLTDGTVHQGWVMEIEDDRLLISTGFSEKQGKDFWISFDQIDLARLQYWDAQQSNWANFVIPV